MKIKVLKKTENELKIEIEGVGHTICNLLQKKLLEDENVDMAGYDVPHPLAQNTIMYVRTKGNISPKEALLKAIERTKEMNKEFGEALKEAFKT